MQGGRQGRLAATAEHFWAVDLVIVASSAGTLPIEVIDALLSLSAHDDGFDSFVAAGPIEDVLTYHPEAYMVPIADRCRRDATWARAVGGVGLDLHTWESLPEPLPSLIPRPKEPRERRRPLRSARKPRAKPPRRDGSREMFVVGQSPSPTSTPARASRPEHRFRARLLAQHTTRGRPIAGLSLLTSVATHLRLKSRLITWRRMGD